MNRIEDLREKVVPMLKPYVSQISVFGSYARGEETPESDIDIIVRLKPDNLRPPLGLRFFGIEMELGKILGRKVDLATEDSLSPYIRPYVEREKVVIYAER